jgi:ketopantoate reductase
MEIEAIVGEPVREGRRLGVPMPKLETIYGLLKAKQLQVKERKGFWEARFAEDAKYA